MSPKPRGDYRPPRQRREIVVAVLVAVAIVVVTGLVIWFVRPNQDSGSSGDTGTPSASTTTIPGAATTTLPAAESTTSPPTSTP